MAVAAGSDWSLALRPDGSLVSVPAGAIPQGLSNVVAVSVRGGHGLALRANGEVVEWGLGEKTNQPPDLTNVVALAAGGRHSVALRADGTVVSWGGLYDNLRRVILDFPSPPPDLTNAVAIAAGDRHALALRADGTVFAWGANDQGQLDLPRGRRRVVAIAAAGDHSLALVDPRGDFAPPRFVSPSALVATVDFPVHYRLWATGQPTGYGVSELPPGLSFDPERGVIHGTPLEADTYRVTLWATNAGGVTRQELTLHVNRPLPALRYQGQRLIAWLGNPFRLELLTEYAPTWHGASGLPAGLYLDPVTGVIQGAPEEEGSFLVSLVARNRHGFGHGSLNLRVGLWASWRPDLFTVSVPGMTNLVALAADGNQSLALRADGRVVAADNPLPFAAYSNIVAVAPGPTHTLVLQADGTVLAWGNNEYGQATVPRNLSNVVAIAAGGTHSLALRRDGTVVGWGRFLAVPVGLSNVVAIAAGNEGASYALLANGRAVTWDHSGLRAYAHGLSYIVALAPGLALLADGTLYSLSGGTQPTGLSNAVGMAFDGYRIYALQADGSLAYTSATGGYPVGEQLTHLRQVLALAGGGYRGAVLASDCPVFFRDGRARPGARARLVAPLLEGQPAFRQWYHNGRLLPGATGPVLEIPAVRPEALGTYTALTALSFATLTNALITLQLEPGLHLHGEPAELVRLPGEEGALRWRLINAGPDPATDAVLSCDIPEAFEILDVAAGDGRVRLEDGRLLVTWPEVPWDVELEVRVRLRARAAGAGAFRATIIGGPAPAPVLGVVLEALPVLGWEWTDSGPEGTWPVTAAGFTLEETEDLTPPVRWQRLPVYPEVRGDRYRVRFPWNVNRLFYRLAR